MKKKGKILEAIGILIIFLIPIFFNTINSELIVSDEIWNFQNVMKMINGRKIYIDCNVIVMPLFYYIGIIILKIFGTNILGFRIYNILIFLLLILSSFFIFRSLKITKLKSVLYSFIILLFVMPYISGGANYNVLAIDLYFLGILIILNEEKIKRYNLWQGLIIYFIIFTKQNIGALYVLALIITEMYYNKKEGIKNLFKEGIISFSLLLISMVVMHLNGNLNGLINYTILGMSEFTTNNLKIQEGIETILATYVTIIIFSNILIIYLSKNKEIKDEKILVLIFFSITLNFSAYPIVNLYHTSFAILINVMLFIYLADKIFLENIITNKITVLLIIIIAMFINIWGIICGLKLDKTERIKDKNNVYYSSIIDKELNKQMNEITDYIKNKEKEGIDVICVSADSALYMIKLNKNHQELDLIFEGNLGYNGKENTLNKIKNLDYNVEILMNKEMFWQELIELREYIIQNYKNVDIMGECLVFKK